MITVTPFIGQHLAHFGVESYRYCVTDDAGSTAQLDESAKSTPVFVEHIQRAPDPVLPSVSSSESRKKASDAMRHFRSLSLMSGAGGIDIGLSHADNSGYFRTEWAVEWSSSSLRTFIGHHPHTKFIEMDVGEALLQRTKLIDMPKPGQVDSIIMGPPCQSFSSLNRTMLSPRPYDERSLLVATGLSYVDVYRPVYGVIENVTGMLTRGDLGDVKNDSVIKFIYACLDSLGYNSRFCRLECGHFYVPQKRARVKIIFARKDVTLPKAPVPTSKLAGEDDEKGGPGDAITVSNATSDLQRFDCFHPRRMYDKHACLADSRRKTERPLRYRPRADGTYGPSRCEYRLPPENAFQRSVRPAYLLTGRNTVTEHYTIPLSELDVERIHNIPLHAGSNHRDLWNGFDRLALPPSVELDDPYTSEMAFRRLDSTSHFQIVTTSIYLGGKHGRLLMPDQQRIPTLRELARCQGFPDHIKFAGTPLEILRQIGNAVPIPLAMAIGLTIREAAIDDYLNGDRRFARMS